MRSNGPKYLQEAFQTRAASSAPSSGRRSSRSRMTSSTASSSGTGVDQVYIVAVCENKAREVGLAAFNVHLSQLHFSQFSDSYSNATTLAQLHLYSPREILVPHTTAQSLLATLLRQRYGAVANVVEINRRFFNETTGAEYIQQLAASPLALDCFESKYLSLAAVAAIIKYYEHIQGTVFPNASLKITYRAVEGYMHIDADTIKNLELIRNLRTGDTTHSLFGVINHTKTAGGARLLRTSLLQPLCDMATIETRLGCVDELLASEKLFFELSSVMPEFLDLDHLAALQFVQTAPSSGLYGCEQTISNMIYLKQSLDVVERLRAVLSASNDGAGPRNLLLQTILASMRRPEIQAVRDAIHLYLEPDTRKRPGAIAMRTERYFAVKAGLNGLLDVARKTYVEVLDDVQELLSQYASEFMMDALVLKNNSKRGYFFALPAKSKIKPSDFDVFSHVQKQANGSWIFTSEELESYNERLRESGAEMSLLTAKVVDELVVKVRDHLGSIHGVSDSTAMLDMMLSFATWVSLSDQPVVRPELSDAGPIAIKQGVHPLVSGLQADTEFIPNDTYLSSVSNFQIISGQNMAGKSTYIKQVAMITLLAHLGSYVPAAWASIRLTDRIFSRIGTDDDLEHNSSTFLVEMREVANILHNTTRRSLVIVDELGRGTSTSDGLGLAWSISEYLLSMPCYTLFTTHFRELTTKLAQLYPNVKNYNMAADPNNRSTFVLTEGAAMATGYGLRAAAGAGIEEAVVARAHAIKASLESHRAQQANVVANDAVYFAAAEKVLALRNSSMDKDALADYLVELKNTL